MKISIQAFGIAKDILKSDRLELELPEGSTTADLRQQLFQQYPEFIRLKSLAIAINANYSTGTEVIHSEDELVLIPPVSGG